MKSHQKFRDKFSLQFPLLADADHAVSDLYGVWGPKKFMGREYMGVDRTTFIIGPDGKIARVFDEGEAGRPRAGDPAGAERVEVVGGRRHATG